MLLILFSINSALRKDDHTESDGFRMAEVEPYLDAWETDYFTFYTSKDSSELLLMEFPLSVIDVEVPTSMIFGASYAQGAFDDRSTLTILHYPAENTDETAFQFRITEDGSGIDLLREELTLRTSDEETVDSLRRSAPPEWLATLPVLDVRSKKGVDDETFFVTSAESLLLNGFFITDISETILDSMRLKQGETRAFPNNAGVTVEYRLADVHEDGEVDLLPMSIRFSVSALPAEKMQPRLSDERVGYFNTVFRDLGDHRADKTGRATDLVDTKVTLINKRRMGDKPLIYYVDPSVPEEWRPYIKEGIEAWQPAFEEAGLGKNSIRAILPSDDDFPDEFDAGDVRFNSVTWAIDMNEVFAVGPSTIDPRTGEILHSSIVFTNGWIGAWSRMFEMYADSSSTDESGRRRSLLESALDKHQHAHGRNPNTAQHPFFRSEFHHDHHGHAHHHGASHNHHHGYVHTTGVGADKRKAGHDTAADKTWEALTRLLPSLGSPGSGHGAAGSLRYHERMGCQEARLRDMSASLLPLIEAAHRRSRALADDTLSATPGEITNEILGKGLKDVLMHEVGHTLGLRHNFKGSAALSLEDLQDPSVTEEKGLTSSVMDYLPLNFVSSKMRGSEQPYYFPHKIGEYDVWAIKYGYMAVDGEQLLEQHEDLASLASAALEFGTDEDRADAGGPDPLTSVFDLGKEPIAFWEDRLELLAELWPVLLDRTTQEGDPFTRYGKAGLSLMMQLIIAGTYASKYIGGYEISKQRRISDDTASPVTFVSCGEQRRALELILTILGKDSIETGRFLPSRTDVSAMATQTGYCDGLEQDCYSVEPLDVVTEISFVRKMILAQAFRVERVSRLRLHAWSNAHDGDDDTMDVAELFTNTTNTIWGEEGLQGARAQSWENWDLMLFWLELLQAYGSAGVSTAIPGDVSAISSGLVYTLLASGENLTASDPAYGLYRAMTRKIHAWEAHGTDGYLLYMLWDPPSL